MMKMSAGALLAAGIWPGALRAQQPATENFSFICVNDLHYWDAGCAPFFNRAIKLMKDSAPQSKLLIVDGDLTEHGTAAEFDGIKALLKTTGMEMKVVPGNHDWATQTDRKGYEEAWPDSLNYSMESGGWQFVFLDSTDGTKARVAVQAPTMQWVEQNAPRLNKNRPTVLVTHFPLGEGITNRATNADALLEHFKEINLRAVFNGHHHAFTEKSRGEIIFTTDKCCSFRANNHDRTTEKGFFVCEVADGKLSRRFVEVPIA